MIFNSLLFGVFLPTVFVFYWIIFRGSLRLQNLLLLAASYLFYSVWDWRFVFLLIFSTLLDYFSGLRIAASETNQARKFWLILSVVINLGFLATFKYYNFFIESFHNLLSLFGYDGDYWILRIILPVGISFYTFHGLSYVFDVYNRKIEPRKNFVDYAVFVSFFPLLVAGPIERATHLLPQIEKERTFDRGLATDGLRQILWGLFKKVVIADNCAEFANIIFAHPERYEGPTLWLGAVFFAFQIYGDFSGYSDIALGTAKLFGIRLLRNFAYPYFSRDIAEFWRRWHISLTSWFRDYLYYPLGGNRGTLLQTIRNTFVVFIVSGVWHGAGWTFILWGILNAVYFMPLLISGNNRKHLDVVASNRTWPTLKELMNILFTFVLTLIAWVLFRSNSLDKAWIYLKRMFTTIGKIEFTPYYLFILLVLFILIEWRGRTDEFAISRLGIKWPAPVRWAFYYSVMLIIFIFMGEPQQFIYFQF
jgi:alginate O-acetyltransferase complex protein AlgI